MSTPAEKEHAHELIERLPVDRISTVVRFLEFWCTATDGRGKPARPERSQGGN